MNTIQIYKAQPIVQEEPVESVTILIEEPIPDFGLSLSDARFTYEQEAKKLAMALLDALPGGIIDQLLVEMLRRKASLFRVRFGGEK